MSVDESNGEEKRFTIVDYGDGTLSAMPRHNLAQGLTVLLFMAVGAGIGFALVKDRRDLAALVGVVLGMVLGAFASGFVLMLLPPPRIQLTRTQIRRRYAACRRRARISGIVAVLMLIGLPIVIGIFGHDASDVAWLMCLGWPLVTVGACVYAKGLAQRLREWRCPECNVSLRVARPICPECGFSMVASAEHEAQS